MSSISSSQRAGIPSCAVFRGTGPIDGEYLVFQATRELEVLSSREISISFGASVDTLPQIRQTGAEVRVIRRLATGKRSLDRKMSSSVWALRRLEALEEAIGEGYLLAPEALRSLVTDEDLWNVEGGGGGGGGFWGGGGAIRFTTFLEKRPISCMMPWSPRTRPAHGFDPAFVSGLLDYYLTDPRFLFECAERAWICWSALRPAGCRLASPRIDQDLLRAKAGLRAFHTASRYYPNLPSIPSTPAWHPHLRAGLRRGPAQCHAPRAL